MYLKIQTAPPQNPEKQRQKSHKFKATKIHTLKWYLYPLLESSLIITYNRIFRIKICFGIGKSLESFFPRIGVGGGTFCVAAPPSVEISIKIFDFVVNCCYLDRRGFYVIGIEKWNIGVLFRQRVIGYFFNYLKQKKGTISFKGYDTRKRLNVKEII